MFLILLVAAGWMFHRSQRSRIDHRNVNDDWVEQVTGIETETVGGAS